MTPSVPVPPAYFIADGPDRYLPTELTGGAWREDEQHLAPVAGLVVHHMELWRREHADPSLAFSRFSFEVLGQIARAPITLTTEAVRPGRTITLIETTATIAGRVTVRARAWLLQRTDTSAVAGSEFDPMPALDTMPEFDMDQVWGGGFIRSLQGRRSTDSRAGRGKAWLRTDHPLVHGEQASPLAEFLGLVDTANGIAARESIDAWMFPNVDLTVHLFRQPEGRWVGFDTRVAFGPGGLGLTSSVLHDARGPVGAVHQSLTVRARS